MMSLQNKQSLKYFYGFCSYYINIHSSSAYLKIHSLKNKHGSYYIHSNSLNKNYFRFNAHPFINIFIIYFFKVKTNI